MDALIRSDSQIHLKNDQIKEKRMAYSLDTKVGELLKDSGAVQVFERYAPGVSKNPMIGLAKGMSLKTLIAMPQAKENGITEEMVLKVLAEINAKK
jgi:hypothetical protein